MTPTTTTLTPFADLAGALLALGYREGLPPSMTRASVTIDREAFRNAKCGHCGREGLDYRPYHRPGSHVALAACPECGHTEEF